MSTTKAWRKSVSGGHWLSLSWRRLSDRKTLLLRGSVFFTLAAATAIVGYFAFHLLSTQETEAAEEQFTSVSEVSLKRIVTEFNRRRDVGRLLGYEFSTENPDPATWPYAQIDDFTSYQSILSGIFPLSTASVAVVVNETYVSDFEIYAYEDFIPSEYDSTAAQHDFGEGIFKYLNSGERAHDTSGATDWGSPNTQFLVPVVYTSDPEQLLMYNSRSDRSRGEAIDDVLSCVSFYRWGNWQGGVSAASEVCSVSATLIQNEVEYGSEDSIIYTWVQPIFAGDALLESSNSTDSFNVVGFAFTDWDWGVLFESLLPDFLSAVDIVVAASDNQEFTYRVDKGKVSLLATKDAHDPKYNRYQMKYSIAEDSQESERMKASRYETEYSIAFYPTDEYFEDYETGNPITFTVGAVCIIFFTTLVFIAYDYFMRAESSDKSFIIDTRRKFVRFISHEIRTPLNTVLLGMKLLETELLGLLELAETSRTMYPTGEPTTAAGAMMGISKGYEEAVGSSKKRAGAVVANFWRRAMKRGSSIVPTAGGSPTASGSPTAGGSTTTRGFTTITTTTATATTTAAAVAAAAAAATTTAGVGQEQHKLAQLATIDGDSSRDSIFFNGNARRRKSSSDTALLTLSSSELSLTVSQAEEWLQTSQEVMENAQNAVDVLNDLLNYDKIESGTLNLEMKEFYVWKFIKQTVSAFEIHAKQKDILLDIDLQGFKTPGAKVSKLFDGDAAAYRENLRRLERLVLVADEVRMAQVLRNLVSNALKFTPRGGTVTVKGIWETPVNWNQPRRAKSPRSPLHSSTAAAAAAPAVDIEEVDCAGAAGNEESAEATAATTTALPKHGWQRLLRCHHDRTDPTPSTLSADDDQFASAMQTTGSLKLTVTDTGAGLSKAQLSKMFGEGVQFNANKLQAGGGSGLGLHITKGIVEQHGGSLTVDSAGLDRGCTFTLKMPVYQSKAPTTPGAPSAPSFDTSGKDVPDEASTLIGSSCRTREDVSVKLPRKILLVDDAASGRKLLARLLQSKGHSCDQVEDGSEVIKLYENYLCMTASGDPAACWYDTVLMDWEMPIMTGPDTTFRLRELGCRCIIIGLTGNMLPADVRKFNEHGTNEVLGKPLKIEMLEHTWKQSCCIESWAPMKGTELEKRIKKINTSLASSPAAPTMREYSRSLFLSGGDRNKSGAVEVYE